MLEEEEGGWWRMDGWARGEEVLVHREAVMGEEVRDGG